MGPNETRYALGLPADGHLVRIPLLSSANPWYNLTAAATNTKASSVTATGTTAAITYASLRFLGLLVRVSASAMAGPVQFQVTSALAQGGNQVIYGNQQGLVQPRAITQGTAANTAWGAGTIFIPGMRTKPPLSRTQTVQVKLAANFLTSTVKFATPVIATVEAICSAISDPAAERERVRYVDEDERPRRRGRF